MKNNNTHTYDYPGVEVATDIVVAAVNTIARLPETAFRVLTVWQKRHEERLHLNAMDDYLIKDMGLTRGDVRHEVNKPFWDA